MRSLSYLFILIAMFLAGCEEDCEHKTHVNRFFYTNSTEHKVEFNYFGILELDNPRLAFQLNDTRPTFTEEVTIEGRNLGLFTADSLYVQFDDTLSYMFRLDSCRAADAVEVAVSPLCGAGWDYGDRAYCIDASTSSYTVDSALYAFVKSR